MKLEELTQEGLDELTSQLLLEQGHRAAAEGQASEMSSTVAGKDTRITELEQAVANSDEALTNVKDSLAQAVSSYKTAVAQANPGVPGELIKGDTIEAVDQSLESSKSLVSTVRASVEADIAAGRVPAGAPARTPPDLSALSPREKIQYAINKGGK